MADRHRVGELPEPPLQVAIWGRKGQGKSELAWRLWDSWEADRLVVDVTGDVHAKHPDPDTLLLDSPLPARWPSDLTRGDERLSLRFQGDPTDPEWPDELDRAIGLAYTHGDCLVWIEEAGVVAPAGRTKPHARAALHMGRHQGLSSIWTMPRPADIDPLIIANADVCYAFDTPNPNDRRRAAASMGLTPNDMDRINAELRDHEYLRYIAKLKEAIVFPPLPEPDPHHSRERHIERHLASPAPAGVLP